MIQCVNLSKKYDRYVIKNFNYNFNDKGLYLIVGKSGIGKTTLLNIISGKETNFEGSLGVDNNVLFLQDKCCLVGSLTVRENIKIFEHANDKPLKYFFSVDQIINKKVKNISLGERQMLIMNLALNSKEKTVVLDEPFSAMSIENEKKACEYLDNLSKEKLFIIATHKFSFFKNHTIIELKKFFGSIRSSFFASYYRKMKYPFKKFYKELYIKKTLINKIIFAISFLFTILSFLFANKYLDSNFVNYLGTFDEREGAIISRKNEITEINEDIFYEVIKKIAFYVEDYNANYYNSKLYEYDITVDGYYIDNGFNFGSVGYIEKTMDDKELVIGMNYKNFCEYNRIYNCDENYLKSILIGRIINDFPFFINDIFDNESTVVLTNRRFFRIYENNDYKEYYFDVLKINKDRLFGVINSNDFLLNFNYIRIGESEEHYRYRVEVKKNKNFIGDNIGYSKYIVCMEKGYNCLDYFNHFNSLVSIENFKEVSRIDFKLYDGELGIREIVLSSGLSKELGKIEGDEISLNFEYRGVMNSVKLRIIGIINDSRYYLCHNSWWTYTFFESVLGFDNEDLQINNLIVYGKINEDDYRENDYYNNLISELKDTLLRVKKIIFLLNLFIMVINILILILLEIFNNRFKKEYYMYLDVLNIKISNKKV